MNAYFFPSVAWIRFAVFALLSVALMASVPNAHGQPKPKEKIGQPKPKVEKTKNPEVDPPDPENVTVETKDGVSIKATYYASGPAQKDKKQSIPIIMLHGWEGNRGDWHAIAVYLQTKGYTVMCPDLRGHGQSLKYKLDNGESAEFDLEKMKGPEIENMVLDVEAVKQFLVNKNNAGELNIEALCVVGAHVGGTIGMMWSAADWNVRSLPSFKQGQDVKAMVLLSPVESFRGVTTRGPMTHPVVRAKLSTLLCVGKQDAKAYGDAKRMYSAMLRFHGKPPADEKEAAEKQDLFFVEEETSLQGTDLLRNGLQTPGDIEKFLHLRLALKRDRYEWTERKNPLKSE